MRPTERSCSSTPKRRFKSSRRSTRRRRVLLLRRRHAKLRSRQIQPRERHRQRRRPPPSSKRPPKIHSSSKKESPRESQPMAVGIISLYSDHYLHELIERALSDAKATLKVVSHVEFFGTACALVAHNVGVTLVDAATGAHFERSGLAVRPFSPMLHLHICDVSTNTAPAVPHRARLCQRVPKRPSGSAGAIIDVSARAASFASMDAAAAQASP